MIALSMDRQSAHITKSNQIVFFVVSISTNKATLVIFFKLIDKQWHQIISLFHVLILEPDFVKEVLWVLHLYDFLHVMLDLLKKTVLYYPATLFKIVEFKLIKVLHVQLERLL